MIPWLYLKGISTGNFSEALAALVGPKAKGLSPSTITRLKEVCQREFQDWSGRSLEGKNYVYVWADGVHFNIRLEEDRQCILVLMGATADGQKELIAISDGFRESEHSWLALLLDVKARGLTIDPKLAIADGALGFWKAVSQVYLATREQRCWVHETADVLDKHPKRLQPHAKGKIHQIWMAETRADAAKAFDLFLETYQAKYPQATECLAKDRLALLTLSDNAHQQHLTIAGQRSAVSDQRSAVSGQRSAVSGQRSAVSGQRSAVSFWRPRGWQWRWIQCVSDLRFGGRVMRSSLKAES